MTAAERRPLVAPSAPPMRRAHATRRVLAAGLVLAPLILVPLASRALVDHTASFVGTNLADLFAIAFAWRTPATDTQALHAAPNADLPGIEILPPTEEASSPSRGGRHAAPSSSTAPRGGIVVRAALVAAAVRSGSRPSGVPVPASGPRPAGLALSGVGGFGAGLRDGDVLTSVAGAPATSVGSVVSAVAGALQQKASVITGEVWRGEQRLALAVEIPEMRGAAPPPARGLSGPSTPDQARPGPRVHQPRKARSMQKSVAAHGPPKMPL